MWVILDKVSLKGVVEKLPSGLDTVLEGQNMSMSGGGIGGYVLQGGTEGVVRMK